MDPTDPDLDSDQNQQHCSVVSVADLDFFSKFFCLLVHFEGNSSQINVIKKSRQNSRNQGFFLSICA
jgi:hypothetical protein